MTAPHRSTLAQRWPDVVSGVDRSAGAAAARALAALVEPAYRAAVAGRNMAFDRGWRRVGRAHCAVISVGNITTGGTGKTPMTIELVRRLQCRNRRPAVVLRGYRSTDAGSDEANELRQALGDVPIVVDADRVAAAAQVQRDHPAVDVIVLDDGFQHRRIDRDLDLVLIDATCPFGHGRLLPRGLLREPASNLARADAVIITRADQVDAEQLAALDRGIEQLHGRRPIAHAAHDWAGIVDGRDQPVAAADEGPTSPGRPRVVAACGIANPRPFMAQAGRRFDVAAERTFADHHAYTEADAARLAAMVSEHDADALLTTDKDWVKLGPLLESTQPPVSVWRPRLTMRLRDGDGELDALLGHLPAMETG